MVRNSGEFVDCLEQGNRMYGVGPDARIIARKGDFGAEHVIEHVKIRTGPRGFEVVIQIAEAPNAG